MESFRLSLCVFSLCLLNVRTFVGGIGDNDTLILTLTINLLLLLAIDYSHYLKKFLFVGLLFPIMIYNREILALLDILLCVYLFRKFPIKTLAFINLSLLLIGFLFLTLLRELDILTINQEIWYLTGKGAARTYGFNNPNTFGGFIFSLIVNAYIIFISFKRNSLLVLFLLWIAIISYNYCLSRMMLIGSIVLILVHFMVKWRIFKKWMRYCVAFLPVLFFLVNFYLIANLSDFKDIDVLTSGRLGIYAGVLGMMTKLNWLIGVQLPDGPMDGSLWMLFFTGGITGLLFFFVNFYFSVTRCFKELYIYFPVILAVLVSGFVENTFSSVGGVSIIFWLLVCRFYTQKSYNL